MPVGTEHLLTYSAGFECLVMFTSISSDWVLKESTRFGQYNRMIIDYFLGSLRSLIRSGNILASRQSHLKAQSFAL